MGERLLMRPLASSCFLITRKFAKSLALPQTWSYGSAIKNLPANAGDLGLIPGLGRSLEEEMATSSNILAWEIPWTEEPGRLQSMGVQSQK